MATVTTEWGAGMTFNSEVGNHRVIMDLGYQLSSFPRHEY
jgi:hypothetical protein